MYNYKTTSYIFILFITLIITGCSLNKAAPEPTPRNIEILLGIRYPLTDFPTYFQIVDENVLEITVFTQIEYLIEAGAIENVILFDTTTIDDFVSIHGNNVLGSVQLEMDHWVYDKTERVLSQRQLNNIWRLADNVVNSEKLVNSDGDEGFEWIDQAHYVWVIIDGEMYWSYLDANVNPSNPDQYEIGCVNDDLLSLVYYFIDLSPIKMGYERVDELNNLGIWSN
jgi:hypothetical protein